MNGSLSFKLELERHNDYEFRLRFDWPQVDELLLDEPAPIGGSAAPNAARRIGAAVAVQHFDRGLAQFEDFCVVTESVRHGIPVGVRVVDAGGVEVFAGGLPGQSRLAPPGQLGRYE